MNSKISETTIRRMLAAHEERMQRIIEDEQEEKKRYYNLSFKLVGTLNMLDIIPGFVIPIFICLQDEPEEPNEMNKPFYFQVGDDEKDTLICFSKLENYGEHCKQRVQKLRKNNSYVDVVLNIHSTPLYAFQFSQDNVQYGNYPEMKEFFTVYLAEDEMLKEEIQDFLQLESNYLWERVHVELERAFPDDSADEIEIKLRSLKNNDFYEEDLELYVPKFQDAVLRVGVRVKGKNRKVYFSTQYEKDLNNILDD